MSFRDYTFPDVATALSLQLQDANLFADTPPYPVREVIIGSPGHESPVAPILHAV